MPQKSLAWKLELEMRFQDKKWVVLVSLLLMVSFMKTHGREKDYGTSHSAILTRTIESHAKDHAANNLIGKDLQLLLTRLRKL